MQNITPVLQAIPWYSVYHLKTCKTDIFLQKSTSSSHMATNLPKITSVCYNPLARLQNPLTQLTRKNFLCMPLLKDILCLVHVRERLLRCFKITNIELQNQNSYRSKNKLLKTNPILDTISAHCHCS